MNAYDREYFKAYYEKKRDEIAERRKKKYRADKAYREKSLKRSRTFRRLELIIEKLQQLFQEVTLWQQKQKQKR